MSSVVVAALNIVIAVCIVVSIRYLGIVIKDIYGQFSDRETVVLKNVRDGIFAVLRIVYRAPKRPGLISKDYGAGTLLMLPSGTLR